MADPETPPGGQFGHVTLGVVLIGQLSAAVAAPQCDLIGQLSSAMAAPQCDLIGQLALHHVTHLKQLIGQI